MDPANLCRVCKGRGQTRATETMMVKRAVPLTVVFKDGAKRKISMRTVYQGSGCPTCHGTGIAPVKATVVRIADKQRSKLETELAELLTKEIPSQSLKLAS